MNEKKSVNEKLSDALDVDFETEEKKPKETDITVHDETETRMIPSPEVTKQDYNLVRNNLKDLINTGQEAIEGILNVAMEGDAPRAFEVAAQMIKTVADTNKDLIDLHKKMKEINKEEVNINNTTNQSIYVGSTTDLLNIINKERSTQKQLNHDIIDVEVEEDGK